MANLQPLVTPVSSSYHPPANINSKYKKLSQQVTFHLHHIALRTELEYSLNPILGHHTHMNENASNMVVKDSTLNIQPLKHS